MINRPGYVRLAVNAGPMPARIRQPEAESIAGDSDTNCRLPRISRGFRATTLLACLSAAALGLTSNLQAADWTVVASGLNNPRGLDFAPNGALYIAEAGTGGNGPTVQSGDGGTLHFGLSGSITRLFKGVQERVASGLPSLANADGTAAIGPSSVSFGQFGHALVTIGLGQPPVRRQTILGPQAALMGTLQQMTQNGQMKQVADLAAFELANDPDGNGADSNPNGVTAEKAGGAYVTDAGGNSLLSISANCAVAVVAVFPNVLVPKPPFLPPSVPALIPMQAVPTNVVRGPDGALYVSQLTGFPFPPGAAKIFRVVPGSAPTVYASGFTNVIDLAFDAQGNLYVLEIDQNGLLAPSPTGRLARVNVSNNSVVTVASTGLVMPGGMVIGPDGAIYVSNYSTAPGAGQVVRIQP
jgi:hypothetical protein